MIPTFNGCSRSNFTVSPANWKTSKASTQKPWRIFYRFYDPAFKDDPRYLGVKHCINRDMNIHKDLRDRQDVTRELLKNEEELIDTLGFNPITRLYMAPLPEPEPEPADTNLITPSSSIIDGLRWALKEVEIVKETKTDMRSVLKYFEQSAAALKKDKLPLNQITRGDIVDILDNCKTLKVERIVKGERKIRNKIWTPNQFNHYRKYLHILYSFLDMKEIVGKNLIEKIPLKEDVSEEEKAPRAILSDNDGKRVNLILEEKDPNFLRFVHIFFHSGARIKELMRVQGKHVDLGNQRFRVLIKKRKKKAWVWKTIKDIAMPFWIEVMKGCRPDDFAFSLDFLPGAKQILTNVPSRRWKKLIKSKGIKEDLYPLKHKNTTVMIDMIIEEARRRKEAQLAVAEHNSHLSGHMVDTVYDVKSAERKHAEIKELKNTF